MHSSVLAEMLTSQSAIQSAATGYPGSSDENPIVVPEVDANAFRNLLVMFYGIISDPLYQQFISDAADENLRNSDMFKRYLGIAVTSQQLRIDGLEDWARKQLNLVMSSPERLAGYNWDRDILIAGLSYAKQTWDTDLERNVRNLICCHLQARGGWLSGSPIVQVVNDTLVHFYQNPELKDDDPALFGFVFCSILSLGHKSSVWKNLTQEDRTKLMVSQVYLTPLPRTALHLGWIYHPSDLPDFINADRSTECSSECGKRFTTLVLRKTFTQDYLKRLESQAPLIGISALRELPRLRRDMITTMRKGDFSWEIETDCLERIMLWLDQKINIVFTTLGNSYHNKIH
ncbi:hypothetical protein RhiJN_25410 [Ceratobasidium sp. AG-Ba]|nr:hypothetical protein RhiJN_25410 [Ceratobasidium sp. AG-Ba]